MIQRVLLMLIRLYQVAISPLTGPCCRFIPTCSQYAYEAILLHGPRRGGWMAICRLGRCHPFHPGGYDPVKPTAHLTSFQKLWSNAEWKKG